MKSDVRVKVDGVGYRRRANFDIAVPHLISRVDQSVFARGPFGNARRAGRQGVRISSVRLEIF